MDNVMVRFLPDLLLKLSQLYCSYQKEANRGLRNVCIDLFLSLPHLSRSCQKGPDRSVNGERDNVSNFLKNSGERI